MKETVNNTLKFGTWEVLPSGDLLEEETGLFIHGERVQEIDWILHAITQNWNLNDFVPAFYEAVKLNKLTHITFQVDYE